MGELSEAMERLAAFEPTTLPVISLYLNAQPDQHGQDNYDSFIRKELRTRVRAFSQPAERDSFKRDMERIMTYLRDEARPSANGLAVFACAGKDDFFEALQFDAAIPEHKLYVYNQPHLYPLARLMDQYRRYAALVADTNAARLFVFGRGKTLNSDTVDNPNVSRSKMGGWSQMRYQRHIDNYYLHHAKEVIDALDRLVRDEGIEDIILAGDEVIIPLLKEQMPKHLAEKVIDVMRLDITTPEHEVMRATAEVFREHEAQNDAERVENLLGEYRAGGLAVVGPRKTLMALTMGQVDQLVISASLEQLYEEEEEVDALLAPHIPAGEGEEDDSTRKVLMADELVTRAQQTNATVIFIEDNSLLASVGGVGARLRFKI